MTAGEKAVLHRGGAPADRERRPRSRKVATGARLLIDGVVFQMNQSGVGGMWASLLPALITEPCLDVLVLDRGDAPDIAGMKRIPFPTFTRDRYSADDSALIQRVCDLYAVDVFTSTCYTTPLTTPMFLLICEMIGGLSDYCPSRRAPKEKAIAISYARRHIFTSRDTHEDILRVYPDLDHVTVADPAYDRSVFRPVDEDRVLAFRRSIGLDRRPYVIIAGEREHTNGHEDVRLLFNALAAGKRDDLDILYIGEPTIDDDILKSLPVNVQIKRLIATHADAAAAYSGAFALVYLTLDGDFGSPVLKAMACRCPVITSSSSPLGELAGDAALVVDHTTPGQLLAALDKLWSTTIRSSFQTAGLEQARKFDGSSMISAILGAVQALAPLSADPSYRQFAETWSTLRRMQSEVDVDQF